MSNILKNGFMQINILLILGCLLSLTFCSCQTSKYHFLFQQYYLPKLLKKYIFSERYTYFSQLDDYYLKLDKKYTGIWCGWYKNGNMSDKLYIVNGVANGQCFCWYENGSISYKCTRINGELNGLFEIWNEAGIKVEESVYVNGKKLNR